MKKLLPSSEFARNVLTLMTGTTIAQAIPIAISPILTRIYTPEDFGFLAMYLFSISFLANMATGKYELGIYLPRQDSVARHVLELALMLATLFSVLLLVLIFFCDAMLVSMLDFKHSVLWLYVIPFAVLISASYQSMSQFIIRMSKFKELSINRIVLSITNSFTSVFLGLFFVLSYGLVVGQIASYLIALIFISKGSGVVFPNKKKVKVCVLLAKKYINFPKHVLISSMINNIGSNMPIFILNSNFGLSASGFYSFVEKVFGVPLGIVGNSFSEVFRQKAGAEYIKYGNCSNTFLLVFKKLFMLSFFPFVIFYFFAPDLFAFLFGDAWRVSGEYAQILTPMFFIKFITMPVSSVILLANKTIFDLWWQLGFLVIAVIGYFISDDVEILVAYFSLGFSFMYLISFYINYRLAKDGGEAFVKK